MFSRLQDWFGRFRGHQRVDSMTPGRGDAQRQKYTAVFSSTSGYSSLTVQNILLRSDLNGRDACYSAYDARSNILYFVSDDGGGILGLSPAGPATNGSFIGTQANSQCRIHGSTSSYLIHAASRTTGDVSSGGQITGTWSPDERNCRSGADGLPEFARSLGRLRRP